jgi:hypothetical protein
LTYITYVASRTCTPSERDDSPDLSPLALSLSLSLSRSPPSSVEPHDSSGSEYFFDSSINGARKSGIASARSQMAKCDLLGSSEGLRHSQTLTMDEQKVFTTAAAAASMKSNANGPRLVDGWPNYTEDGIERERERERERSEALHGLPLLA